MASTTFAPGRTREREFDFEFTERSNRGNAGALIPVPRYKERDISETIDIQRGPYGERERDRFAERDVYEARGPTEEIRRVQREEIDVTPHRHRKRNSMSRVKKREHTSECICLECVRARRYGEEYKASGQLTIRNEYATPKKEMIQERERERERERDRRTIGYGNYNDGYYTRTEMDVSEVVPYNPSPRGSGYLLSSQQETNRSSGMLANHNNTQVSQDWTVVDVPPGTRRVTVEPGSGPTEMIWSNEKSVRRTRGGHQESQSPGELWTEMTKDLVTAEALQEFGYQYEETEFYYYIFEYLHRDQIQELIELTKDIRRERVKDIEYYDRMQDRMSDSHSRESRSSRREQHPAEYYERDRYESREIYYA